MSSCDAWGCRVAWPLQQVAGKRAGSSWALLLRCAGDLAAAHPHSVCGDRLPLCVFLLLQEWH